MKPYKVIIYNPGSDTFCFSDKIRCKTTCTNVDWIKFFNTTIIGNITPWKLYNVFPKSVNYMYNNSSVLNKKDVVEDVEIYILTDNELIKYATLYNSYISSYGSSSIDLNSDWHYFWDDCIEFDNKDALSIYDLKDMIKYLHNKNG